MPYYHPSRKEAETPDYTTVRDSGRKGLRNNSLNYCTQQNLKRTPNYSPQGKNKNPRVQIYLNDSNESKESKNFKSLQNRINKSIKKHYQIANKM